MAIIKQYNKKTGTTYVYESHSYWDKERKQHRSDRKLIGKIDPETGEIVPTKKKKTGAPAGDESKAQELEKLTTMIQPIIQNLNGWSDENRSVIENDILLPVTMRMIELSDTDLANTLSESLSSQIAKNMMAGMQAQIDGQQAQIDGMQGQIAATQQALPPESQEQLAQDPMAQAAGMPAPNPLEAIPEGAPAPMESGEASPSLPTFPEEETAGQQVEPYEDLLTI